MREALERCFPQDQAAVAPDADAWPRLAELGVLGLLFPETYGGSGLGFREAQIVAEALGRGRVSSAYLPTVVLAASLIDALGSEDQKQAYLPQVAEGRLRMAFAFVERQSRYNAARVGVTAERQADGGYRLDGEKIVVLGAPEADVILVTARTFGAVGDEQGVSVFALSADTPGLQRRNYATVDGGSASEVVLSGVTAPADALLGPEGQAFPAVDRVLDQAAVFVAAEMLGAMKAMNALCVEHVRTREAFGRPLSQFQVLRHRLVDMKIAEEQASAIIEKAVRALDHERDLWVRLVSACKAQVNEEARLVGQHAVQLHGALGVTEEAAVGQYFKRITAAQNLFGSVDHHVRRYARCAARGAA